MSTALPPGVTIAPPPPELELRNDDDEDDDYSFRWHHRYDSDEDALEKATAFPEQVEAEGAPNLLRSSKLFACSGSIDTQRYAEASKFRTLPDMQWLDARVALNRLVADIGIYSSRDRITAREYVALAEFALTASGFEGFDGRKGDNAAKLRDELQAAIRSLHVHLRRTLNQAQGHAEIVAQPITNRLQVKSWHGNGALWAMMPASSDAWVRVIEATAEQAVDTLDFLRATLVTWQTRRAFAEDIAERLQTPVPLPTAEEYAAALSIAEMLAFTGEKLSILYAGMMHSMPIYRLYPGVTEREAIEAWWPWGRAVPLIDGKPPPAPRPSRTTLDTSLIRTTRPQDVVKDVMAQTGMNRISAQRLTAALRRQMREERRRRAWSLLCQGETKAEVARQVGLSPSRISALFKGQRFPTKGPDLRSRRVRI